MRCKSPLFCCIITGRRCMWLISCCVVTGSGSRFKLPNGSLFQSGNSPSLLGRIFATDCWRRLSCWTQAARLRVGEEVDHLSPAEPLLHAVPVADSEQIPVLAQESLAQLAVEAQEPVQLLGE